ncbi:hypothetical protein EIM50_22220, partial [Pseudoxanthomonas sp. SGD-10]
MKYLLILFLLLSLNIKGQTHINQKLLNENGAYLFKPTKTAFPEKIEEFLREDIYIDNKGNKNISVEYKNSNLENWTKITVYIYQAKDGTEGRLRNEYLKSLSLTDDFENINLLTDQSAVQIQGKTYICNGFKAKNTSERKIKNQLTIFECGTWFLKLTTSSNEYSSNQLDSIENKFLEFFDPTNLTETKLLNLKSNLQISPAIGKDQAMLGAVMKSAFKKLEWANTNVADNERVSGFPDIYLNMHIEALKEFGKFDLDNKNTFNLINKKYINEINEIL